MTGLVVLGVILLAIAAAGLLFWQPPRPQEGGFRAWVLDVGQGLAVHVQTRAHDLLYDSGPPFGSSTDAGERVILPWLRAAGVRRLDRLVLSHPDADHAGDDVEQDDRDEGDHNAHGGEDTLVGG